MSSNNKEEKDSAVDNNKEEDSKLEKEKPVAKDTTTIDITKAGSTSKHILDITDTPDVAAWNKSVQIKGNSAKEIVKKSQGREKGGRGGGMTQAKTTPIANNTAIGLKKKEYENLIINPANQKDVDQVINSGGTLTDKAEFSSSYYTKPNKSSQKKYSDQQK
jgi:hypothetical protein